MNEDPKKIMEEGWKARENLEFEKAEKLLNKAKEIFEDNEDWFNVTEALNHLAYTEKLNASYHSLKGIKLCKESERISKEHNIKKELILRALMSLTESAGLFEQALKWGNESLSLISKPLARADTLSHIAGFLLRTGKPIDAEKTINEAESIMTQHFENGEEPHRSIWKCKILKTKALILYNKGDLEGADKYLKEALSISEKQDLKTRTAEIKSIMEMFN